MSKLATISFEVHDDGTETPVNIQWVPEVTPDMARKVLDRLMTPVGAVVRDLADIVEGK